MIEVKDIPTPKADALRHVSTFAEAATVFSVSLALALATAYYRQLEIVLGVAYVAAIAYTLLAFNNNPRPTFFRFAAITLGVTLGIRELFIYFWVNALTVTIVVLALGIGGFMAYRQMQLLLSPQPQKTQTGSKGNE